MPRPQLAKLSRPRLHDAVARERLFRSLDAKREHPVVWVAGPPGSGKTTLVASYLEATSAPAIWYLLDAGDSDPATFFYYLAQAFGLMSRSPRKPLPLLTQEYLPDLEGFARRFVRDVFARLPEGSMLVLDNYHEIAGNSPLHGMLNAALVEVPQSANLIVISRAQPPPLFARARVGGTLEMLEWEELRLEPEEAAAIIARRGALEPEIVAAIHSQSGGWVAGIRLLLERVSKTTSSAILARPEALEGAFDYFAAEIFDAAPEPLRHVMLQTALLPRFTIGMAVALSGDEQAGRRIEQMYKRRLFIDRRLGKLVTYQYHDLFRAFLQSRATQNLPSSEIESLAGGSAEVLLAADLADEAFALFVQAKDWQRAAQLFLERARTLIAHGRWQTLENWGGSLPVHCLEADPWLHYWLGRSKALVDPRNAIPLFNTVYESFTARNDVVGQLLCAAAVVDTLHFGIDHWDTMGQWFDRLTRALDVQVSPLPLDDELQVHATLFWAAEASMPGSPIIAASAARVEELLPACADINLRISAANMLQYLATHTLNARLSRTAAREARPFLDSADLSADRLALYWLAEGMAHVDPGRFAEALACYDRADAVIEQHALAGRATIAGAWRALCHLAAGNLQAASTSLAAVEKLRSKALPLITQILDNVRAWVAFGRGENERALEYIQAARTNCEQWGPSFNLGFFLPNQAYMMIASGRAESAREPLRAIRSHPQVVAHLHFESTIVLVEAWLALRMGQQALCRDALRELLLLARDERERWRLRWFRQGLLDLLPIALELAIETEVARTLIRECGLMPPSSAPETWVWPLKVYTLGRFEVMLDDNPLEFGRKAPRRTMALLKALIALGGKDVPEQRLADALWPDLEGDAALESLAAALHRLRRLLGSNEAIRQSKGILSLNEQRCFVDAWSFEAGVAQQGKERVALRLYRGVFLPSDADAQWSTSMRERLRGKYVRAVESAGRHLETAGQYQEAIDLYSHGIEADELVEPFYRGLMRCYHKLDRLGEAAAAFRHLRQTLSVTLGAKPSAESQKLYQELRLQ